MKLLRKWTDVKISPVWPTARSAAIIRSGSPAPKPGDKISSTVYVKSANSIPGHGGAKPARLCSVQQDVKIDMSPMRLSTETSSIRLYIGSGLYVHKYIVYIYICIIYALYMHVQREREVYKLTTFQSASTPKDNEQEKYIWHLLI